MLKIYICRENRIDGEMSELKDNETIKELIREELEGVKPAYEIEKIISEVIHLEVREKYFVYHEDCILMEIENLPN